MQQKNRRRDDDGLSLPQRGAGIRLMNAAARSKAAGVTGILLCGGRGRRLQGADKPLMHWRGEALAAQVVRRLRPQVAGMVISANRNLEAYRRLAPVVADALPGHQGPLAGIAAALERCPTPWAAVCPGDAPLIPRDLVQRLAAAIGADLSESGQEAGGAGATDRLQCRPVDDASYGPAPAAFVRVGGRSHHLHCLLRTSAIGHLRRYLAAGRRDAQGWLAALGAVAADFSGQEEAFRNFNAAQDFQEGPQ